MKIVVVLADSWCSKFSKPMSAYEAREFKKKYENTYDVIYFERRYNLLELIMRWFNQHPLYIGKLIIIDNRLMGRFGSNEEIKVASSRYRWVAIAKTKLKAMWYDYFIIPSNKAIYFRVSEIKDI